MFKFCVKKIVSQLHTQLMIFFDLQVEAKTVEDFELKSHFKVNQLIVIFDTKIWIDRLLAKSVDHCQSQKSVNNTKSILFFWLRIFKQSVN